LVSAHYDLKHVYRLILNSKTYQLSSIPETNNPQGDANFSHYLARRLEAEVLIDAICQITGTSEKYSKSIPEPSHSFPKTNARSSWPTAASAVLFWRCLDARPATPVWNRSATIAPLPLNNCTCSIQTHIRNKMNKAPNFEP